MDMMFTLEGVQTSIEYMRGVAVRSWHP
jgi:hypothetical protein